MISAPGIKVAVAETAGFGTRVIENQIGQPNGRGFQIADFHMFPGSAQPGIDFIDHGDLNWSHDKIKLQLVPILPCGLKIQE